MKDALGGGRKLNNYILERNMKMIELLSEAIWDYEEYDILQPDTYIKIKEFFEEDVPEKTKERIRSLCLD